MNDRRSMKLIKAYIRTDRAGETVQALEKAGAPGITISRVYGVGYGYEPFLFSLAPGELRKAPQVSKIEIVCCEDDVERLRNALIEAARTGYPGDGIVFVAPIEEATRIRTGESGAQCL